MRKLYNNLLISELIVIGSIAVIFTVASVALQPFISVYNFLYLDFIKAVFQNTIMPVWNLQEEQLINHGNVGLLYSYNFSMVFFLVSQFFIFGVLASKILREVKVWTRLDKYCNSKEFDSKTLKKSQVFLRDILLMAHLVGIGFIGFFTTFYSFEHEYPNRLSLTYSLHQILFYFLFIGFLFATYYCFIVLSVYFVRLKLTKTSKQS